MVYCGNNLHGLLFNATVTPFTCLGYSFSHAEIEYVALLYGTLRYKVVLHRCGTQFAVSCLCHIRFKIMGHWLCSLVQGGLVLVSIIIKKKKNLITWRRVWMGGGGLVFTIH